MKHRPHLHAHHGPHGPVRARLSRAITGWLFTLLALVFPFALDAQTAVTYTADGSFTVPAGVTQVVVECWGGGGRGGTRTSNGQGGGGGGGAYARSLVTVIPGNSYTVTVGAGSNSGSSPGGDSWFGTATTVMAKGGNSCADNSSTGVTGGTAAASIGTVKFSGGAGSNGGSFLFIRWGGGGGSSAGYAAVGGNAPGGNGGGTAPAGGGNGGNGASSQANGSPGIAPGGGGGGAVRTNSGTRAGGTGADGQVIVTYYNNGDCISGTNGFNNIPDNGCSGGANMNAPMPISGLPSTLGTAPGNARLASVELIVEHTYNSDLRITLTSPAGTTRNLVLNRFGSGDNLGNPGACPGTVLTLTDGAAALVNTTMSNVSGTYAPEQSLDGFTGDPNGTWVVNVCDNAGLDVGRFVHARLNFCTVPLITSFSSNSPICEGTNLTLNSAATGDAPLAYSWSGTGTFSPDNLSANVSVSGAATGDYTVTVSNACGSASQIIPVTVNPLPVMTCPADMNVCSSDAAFALAGNGEDPAGGTFSGTGVSGGIFDPAAAGAGTHTITYSYTDGNGCTNSCTFNIDVTAATAWYSDLLDSDGLGDPGDMVMACTQPPGYVADNTDLCPAVSGTVGSACDDGNCYTTGDVISPACVCAGTPIPCDTWTLSIESGSNGGEITWTIQEDGGPCVLQTGGPYANNTVNNENVCVPLGNCFKLTVNDSGGDGIVGGGWKLTDNNGHRILDNEDNGACFANSSTHGLAFCNEPASERTLIPIHCDKTNWLPGDVIIASEDPAVSAQWGIGDQTDDGYQFWFLDPCGSYNRRVFRDHATSGGHGPANAIRASKLKLSSMVSYPLPQNTLLNVRVRTRVNGVNGAWGPACRFMIDANSCTLTQLNNDPSSPNFSCGVAGKSVGASGAAGRITALVVTSGGNPATHYRFNFSVPGEGYSRNMTSSTAVCQLAIWQTAPLLCGTYTYEVRVQASFDGGTTFCPLGEMCQVTITNNTAFCTTPGSMAQQAEVRADAIDDVEFAMYPNPNREGRLFITMNGIADDVEVATVDIFDMLGQRATSATIGVADGLLRTELELPVDMPAGMYLVNITTGDQVRSERLVIQR